MKSIDKNFYLFCDAFGDVIVQCGGLGGGLSIKWIGLLSTKLIIRYENE